LVIINTENWLLRHGDDDVDRVNCRGLIPGVGDGVIHGEGEPVDSTKELRNGSEVRKSEQTETEEQ
jgi:hypothetical protein